mmetsp:Transcript_9694/g.16315  ORF Transcript_9694/g.16315 Transcript_9694/m.16315 type:complete len:155 (-) Transcript_9694:556-1020(-)
MKRIQTTRKLLTPLRGLGLFPQPQLLGTGPLLSIPTRPFSFSWPCPRKLREIVKQSAFERENSETCELIWNEYHHAKEHTVSTTLSKSQYQMLMANGKAAPIFIHPVPKGPHPNHFVLVSQQQESSFLLTFLGDYQVNPSGAHPYMVITAFDEL